MMLEYMFEKDLHKVIETKSHTKDGRLIWVSGVGVKTKYQGRLAGLVSMRDITAIPCLRIKGWINGSDCAAGTC